MRRASRRALAAALTAIIALAAMSGCAPTSAPDRFSLAGGGVTGVYYAFGGELAEALSSRLGSVVTVDETNGSVDNLQRVADGRAVFGFAQSDAAADAVAGVGAFPAPLDVQAVARLYDEYVHVVVRSDSDIRRIADLAGRAVSLGAPGSGVNIVATRVLEAEGLAPMDVADEALGLTDSIAAFRAGEIEGFFWVGGVPTPGLAELFSEAPARLLPIEAETVESVNAEHGGAYRLAEFPIGAYGRTQATATMTVPNYLMVAEEAPDELVRAVLAVLFESRSAIAAEVPAAALLDRRQAIFTDPVDLHPGAVAYYSESRR
ncbi:MAG: TAXI family TRAP transporter solute-binding subunit [Microcella sp.]|uniref:TAXI family TRAP transporter solute-binding subunit n=1 Tax=Microcella sp. TaxID=1913979 RepID=UPI002716C1AF|nr:TAXI family TRAP transporter solute-binding subunit [Microcella sp.]MDO8338486.1 TAXI family TRAP transporter solute-binding subunit [Microcella sp.]